MDRLLQPLTVSLSGHLQLYVPRHLDVDVLVDVLNYDVDVRAVLHLRNDLRVRRL